MTSEIKDRLEQIQLGNVPEGYIKDKDGIHPGDWTAKEMGQWLKLAERPVVLKDDEAYQLVTVRRGFGGVGSRGYYLGESVLVKNYFSVNAGDFIISKRQIAHGACGVVPEELDGAVVSNEYSVFIPQDGTNIQMFNLMMQLPHFKRLFYLMSDGVHIEKLLFKTQDWMRRSLAMPPLEEQKKIAKILTTQDKVIELKEKRLTEKQRQKKYLMQQLLTGKKRLPGYTGKWQYVRASTLFKNVTNKNHDGTLEVLSATQDKGIIPRCQVDIDIKYAEEFLNTYKKVEKGNFVISLRSFQGGIEYSNYTGIVSPAYTILASISPIEDNYYKQFFKSSDYIGRLNIAVYGIRDGKQISYEDFGRIKIPYPPLGEQKAVAEVLSTADCELEILTHDVEQEKQKKKALMQLLLTGIVRVNI